MGQRILKNGMEGADVKELQSLLIQAGYDCGKWGADGDFGDSTENAVRKLQRDCKITIDGQVGPKTLKALETLLADEVEGNPESIKIINGNCNIRKGPKTSYAVVKVAKEGELYDYAGETSEDGWNKTTIGWVSGKYSELV